MFLGVGWAKRKALCRITAVARFERREPADANQRNGDNSFEWIADAGLRSRIIGRRPDAQSASAPTMYNNSRRILST